MNDFIGQNVKIIMFNDQGANQLYDATIKNVRNIGTRTLIDLNEFTNYTLDSKLVGIMQDGKFTRLSELVETVETVDTKETK